MWILPILGYVGVILGFIFLTLAIASGLYYLSELVEEHTVLAKKLLTRLIYSVIVLQAFLALVDHFPWTLSGLTIVSHIVYAQNLRRFPVVKLTDPLFIISCALVILNHYLWFNHFSHLSSSASNPYGYPYSYESSPNPTFSEIASFFGLCVWLTPFALFVSLSASENVLPSMGSEYATGQGSTFVSPGQEPSIRGGYGFNTDPASPTSPAESGFGGGRRPRSNTQKGMAKAVVHGVRDWVGETGAVCMLLVKGRLTSNEPPPMPARQTAMNPHAVVSSGRRMF